MLMVKNLPANAGDIRDMGSIPGLGRYPGGRKENLICQLLLLLKVGRNHFIKQFKQHGKVTFFEEL